MIYSISDLKKSDFINSPHYMVIGNPIGHSLSPFMHNVALKYHGLNAEYIALQLEINEVSEFAAWCNMDSFLGCNITIPFKEMMLEVVDEIDKSAKDIGAINTILKESNSLVGYNTDVYGFVSPLFDLEELISGARAIVFGTGGASKAVKAGLIQLGIEEIVFVSRNPANKSRLGDSSIIKTVDYFQWQSYAEEASIFVNTTPLGMFPKIEDSVLNERDAHLVEGKICYDLIYNPVMSSFLRIADQAGSVIINGLDMFVQQGNRSFELWTGKTFPSELIKEELIRYFERK